MIPVAIETLVVGTPPSPSVVIMRPIAQKEGIGDVLPIWIGPSEAASIGMAIQGNESVRPMTHDLFGFILDATEATLSYVVIDHVEDTTFFATIVLDEDGECLNVDARPSDSIALAVREDAIIYVEEEVMELAAFPAALNPSSIIAVEVEEFHDFIESVNPEDFRV